MSLIEYLFIDEPRLDAYSQQIGPPITYDKVPVWQAEMGLLGPKVRATQNRNARPLTAHEKLTNLLDHLKKNDLVEASRPSDLTLSNRIFVEEILIATRVLIPPGIIQSDDAPGLGLWISLPPEAQQMDANSVLLCLLEDYRKSDTNPVNRLMGSSYSLLEAILWEVRERQPKVVLEAAFWPHDDQLESNRVSEHLAEFVADPIRLLERVGCRPGTPRKIRTLYRVRDVGLNHHVLGGATGTFGYPIFIAAS